LILVVFYFNFEIMITDQEQTIIINIYKRIVPNILLSIQYYKDDIVDRDGCIIGQLKYKNYQYLYINIKNIRPWQLKTFESDANKKMPNRFIIKTKDNITRLIFK